VTFKELIAAVSISLRFELVRVFVHLNHIAASSKNANHEIMRAAVKPCDADCIGTRCILKNRYCFLIYTQSDNLPVTREVTLRGSRGSLNGNRFESEGERCLLDLFCLALFITYDPAFCCSTGRIRPSGELAPRRGLWRETGALE
jgi:hypothetical protein